MRRLLLSVALLASPAAAQELSFASIAIDHAEKDSLFGDNTIQRLDGKVELSYGNAILGADADAYKSTFIAGQGTLQLLAGYRFAPGLTAGVSLGREGKFGEMDNIWSLWAGYEGETFAVGAEAVTDADNFTTYFAAAEVMPNPGLTLAGYVSKEESSPFNFYALEGTYSASNYDLTALARISTGDDFDLLAVRGTYRVNDKFDLGGGYGQWQPVIGSSRAAMFVTAGYRLAEGTRAYATFTSRESGGTEDTTGIRLGLTFDFGKSARTADRIISRLDDLGYDFE